MANFQTISHINISKGMDTRSALKNIQEGFAERLINMDTNSAGFSEKRKGYQSYVGSVPFRVTSITEDAQGGYEMEFSDSMSFSQVTASPVLGKGKIWWDKDSADTIRTITTNGSGVITANSSIDPAFVEGQQVKVSDGTTWSTYTMLTATTATPALPLSSTYDYALLEDKEVYWDTFINNIYKPMTSGVTKEFARSDTALDILVGTAVSTTGTEYEVVETDSTTIDANSIDQTVVTPDPALSVLLATYVVPDTAVSNKYSASAIALTGGSLDTISIPQATHGLPDKNIVYQIWQEGASNTLITPESFEIASNGDITIKINEESTQAYTVVLHDVSISNTEISGVSGASQALNLTIPITSEFIFVQAYLLEPTQQTEVKIESIIIDGTSAVLTIDPPTADYDVKFVYLEGKTSAPSITVGAVGEGVTDTTPEFCIYGIDPADVVFENKAGHINTLDEYSSVGQSDVVVGMGGNLFVESTDFTTLISTRVDIRGTTDFSGIQTVLPVFTGEGITSITSTASSAVITLSGTPTLTDIVDEYVTISGAQHSEYTGTFKVTAKDTGGPYTITISGTFDTHTETDTGALISQDSFVLEMEAGYSFEAGDTITSNQFPDYTPIVREVEPSDQAANNIRIGNVLSSQVVYGGVTLTGTRTSNIINTPYTSSFFVKGDVLTLSGYDRKFRVLTLDISDQIHAKITLDEAVTVTDSTLSGTVTGVSLDSRWLCVEHPDYNDRTVKHFSAAYDAQNRLQTAKINDSLFYTDYEGAVMKYDGQDLYQAGLIPWSPQTHTYVDISSAQEKIVIDSYLVTAISQVTPGDGFYELHFDKNTMPPLPANGEIFIQGSGQVYSEKAVTVVDYVSDATAGDYIITVVDTDSVLDADQFAWASEQGVYFTANDKTASVPLTISSTYFDGVNNVAAAIAAYNAVVAATEEVSFSGDGDLVFPSGSVILDETTSVSIPEKVGYYFKLQAYDRNNNIVASATTDYRDCLVTLLKSGRVYHRLNNLPKFSAYHYDRVDLEIYRTAKAETVTPDFFRIRTIPLEFQEYERTTDLLISDSLGNSTFPDSGNDLVSNAISLQTTGTALERPVSYEAPQKSKYITSIANRLIQGNTRGFDSLDLRIDTDTEDTLAGITVATGGETYKFLDAADAGLSVTSIVPAADGESMVLTIPSSSFAEGEWIQLLSTATTNTLEKKSGAALGWWKVSAATTTSTSLTVTSAFGEALTIGTPNYAIKLFRGSAANVVPVASFDKAEFRPFDGTRTGEVTPAYISSIIDLQRAINTVQKSKATPIIYAQSGATFGASVVNLKSATPDGTVSVVVDTSAHATPSDFSIYGNNILQSSGATITGLSPVFPSRLLISPEKFPETFDNPTADSAIYSSAIVDVNADDGEEITGFSSFLAIASSSNSQVQATLIVFKSKSVYAIDVVTRSQTKLESSGQGCTIPGSISPTAAGIMFANKSGIYVVTSSLEVQYIGRNMEGYWNGDVNKSVIETEAVAFTDSIDRKYKLSVPVSAGTTNAETIVYDYITDDGSAGSWSLYDNIPASAWTQTSEETIFGGYGCRVYKKRNTASNTDYRDDTSPITSTFEYSPRGFGDSGEEVLMDSFVTHVESGSAVSVYEALDMSSSYTELDPIVNDGSQRSFAVKNSPTSNNMLFMQVKYIHSVLDENFKIAGIDFRVAMLNAARIPDANS